MNEVENKKPPLSKLAIASLLLVILSLFAFIALLLFRENHYGEPLSIIGAFAVGLLISSGFALGILAHLKIKKSKGKLRGKAFSTVGFLLGIFVVFVILFPPVPSHSVYIHYIMSCYSNIKGLDTAVLLYAADHNGQYPSPIEWCDLLKKQENLNDKQFICKSADILGDKGSCHYAMNPNCETDSPADTVLLFETKGGWNQHGGPELLTLDHHHGKCCVVFNDSHIEIIDTKNLEKLKWNAGP